MMEPGVFEKITDDEFEIINTPKKHFPLIEMLLLNKHLKKSVLEVLTTACRFEYDKERNFIFDQKGSMVLPVSCFEYYHAGDHGSIKCPKCKESFEWNTILFHLESDYPENKGHKLSYLQTTKALESIFTEELSW